MKLYNPFKAHAVRFNNGKYGIRKLGIFCWLYRSRFNSFWWSKREMEDYCQMSREEAENLWNRFRDRGTRIQ